MRYSVMMGFGLALLMFVFPILILIWLHAKGRKEWYSALIGVCVYFNFYYLVFVLIFCTLLGNMLPGFQTMLGTPWGKTFIIALGGGICCEAGRYLGLRFGLGSKNNWLDAVGLGLGYGFAASIARAADVFSTMVLSSYVAELSSGGIDSYLQKMQESGYSTEEAQALLDQLNGITFFDTAMYCVEIISAISFAVALSLLVLGAVRRNTLLRQYPFLCVWIAVIAHVLTDGIPILMQSVWGWGSRSIAAYLAVLSVGALAFVKWVKQFFPDEESGEEPEKPFGKRKGNAAGKAGSISANASRSLRTAGGEEGKETQQD